MRSSGLVGAASLGGGEGFPEVTPGRPEKEKLIAGGNGEEGAPGRGTS